MTTKSGKKQKRRNNKTTTALTTGMLLAPAVLGTIDPIVAKAADTSAPTITSIEGGGYVNGNYKFRVTATDPSGVRAVKFPTWTQANGQDDLNWSWESQELGTYVGNNTWEYTVDLSKHNNEDGRYITHIYVEDNLGNRTAVERTAWVDKVKPYVTGNTYTLEGYWTGTNQYTVRVDGVKDDASGINRVMFPTWSNLNGQDDLIGGWGENSKYAGRQIDEDTWEYTATIDPTKINSGDTAYITHAWAFDGAGNSVPVGGVTILQDLIAPTIVLNQNITTPTKNDVIINATVTEGGSGLVALKWAYGNQPASYFATGGTDFKSDGYFDATQSGTYTVYAKDSVGNASVKTINITNIDKTPPANATFSPSTTAPTNQNVNVTINYPSDAVTKQYKIGSTGTWTTYTTPVVVSADNTTVYARSFDSLGNVSNETNYTVTNIDKVSPTTPTISADVTTATNDNVVLTATFPSDAVVKEYSLNDGTWTAYTGAITMSANGKLEVRAKDSAGNYSAIANYNVTNIDKTPPANATFSPSTTAPTNGNVNVTINYPADAVTKQYKIGSTGTWTTYTTPVVVTADNTVVYARSYDAVGNISGETNYTVTNIDKVAPTTPTISADVTTATNDNVILTATFPSDASVKEYSLNDGAWTSYTTPITMTANGKLEVRAKDSAGNYSAIGTYTVSNIDKTAPANATFSPSTTSPTNQNVNVTINYPADASVKQYKIGSTGTWTTYTTPVVVSADNTVVYARSYDAVGNVSAETSYTVTNIDKVAPTTPTVSADVTTATNGNVVLTATFPSDAIVKEYSLNDGAWTTYTSPITMTANGKLEVRGKDNAGNYSAIGTYNVTNIDKTAPTNATFTPSITSPTNQNVNVTINYPSDASIKQYKIGATGTWTTYSTPVVVSSNNTVYARSYDAVGNVSAESSYVVSNIDKTAPTTPTVSADVTSATNGNVVLSASFPADSTVKEYSLNDGTWTAYTGAITMTSNGKLEVRAKDEAGNYSAVATYNVTNIDKTAPVVATLVPSTTAPTNQNVTVTISYPSDASVKEYKIGSTGTWTAYTTPVALSSNNTVYTRSKDAVGNISAESSLVVNNIDKTAPTTPTISADVTIETNEDVTLTATFPSDALVKEVRVNGGAWTSYTSPIIMTSNGKLEVRAMDQAGNYSAIAIYNVSNIDKTAPVNATLSASTTAPTNQDVSVSISYPVDAVTKQYKLGSGGTWTNYTTPVVLSSNNTVYARSMDAVGNISSEASLTVSNIDKVAPTTPSLVADKTNPTNTDVSVTINYPVDASMKQFRIDGGSWQTYTSSILIAKNSVVEARAIDPAGNISSVSSLTISNIDKTSPEIATFAPSITSPTNQNVSVSINYPSDAVTKQYKIGSGGTWTSYATPVVLSGNDTIYARSIDAVGNVSVESSYAVSNIDKTAPTTPTISADKTTPTNGNVILTASFPSDASVKEYRLNGGVWTTYVTPITMTSNGTMEVRAKDVAGNYSAIESYEVSNIDKTAPINATLSANKTLPTNTDVTVTISYPSDASVKQYKIGSTGTWTTYSSPVMLSANNTVYARSYDAVGNVSEETSLVVSNIDKIAPTTPTISADVTEDTNGNVILTASFPMDASVKEYRLNGGTWTSYTVPVMMTANGTMEVRAKDLAGNYSAIGSYTVSNIDKTAPLNATFVANTTAPTNQDVSVTVNYPVDASVKQYKVGSTGTWTNYTVPVVVSSNNTVYARSYDEVGNVSSESSYVVNNIDKVSPNTPTLVADKTQPTNTNVSVTATFPSDAVVKEVRVNGGTWTVYSNPIIMTANGKVEVRAIDIAGNISSIGSYDVTNIDKTAPSQPTLSADKTTATNTNVVVTANFPSDVVTKEVRINEGVWTAYTNSITMTSNGKVEVRGTDNAGNVSEVSSYDVTNIDKTVPTNPSFMANETKPTNQNVSVTVSYPSDATVKQVRVNSGSWMTYTEAITFTSNGKVEARAIDEAGNVSSITSYEVTNIDKALPSTPTLVADKTNPTNTDVVVTATFPSDSHKKEVRINGGSWTSYTSPVTMTENGKVEVRATDEAGNISAIGSYEVTNIDKIAPLTPTFSADKTSPTNTDVTVSVSFPHDASVKQVRINNGEWVDYTSPITLSSNGKIEALAMDNAGNLSVVSSYTVSNIDKVAPNTPSLTADTTIPTNKNVIVTATFSSDVVKKEVRVNGGSWSTYSNPVVMSSNGTVEVRGTDNAGNVSEVSRYTVNNIDRVAPEKPTISISENANRIELEGESDSKILYRLNDGAWTEYKEAMVLNDGEYTLDVKAVDPATNESEVISENMVMYRDALTVAVEKVEKAEQETTQETVDVAREKVQAMPHDVSEYAPLFKRVNDLQALLDAQEAIEKAIETRNPEDVQDAKDKIDLLDGSNPVIIDIIDEIQAEFNEADILSLIAKERYDILSSKYGMSKVAYNSLVQSYYAIKYTGDTMYKMAKEKFELVPTSDSHYTLVQEQYNNLNVDYDDFVEERIATDAEIKAESSVKVMESNYDPAYAVNTQTLINEVEDATIRASLQQRLDNAKAKYEASQLDKASQSAILAVEKAESTKQTYYVSEAYKKVNALTDVTLKIELTSRLQALEAQMELDRKISDATRTVQLAEQYKYQQYIDSAQTKVSALPDGEVKTSLQQRLDALKSGLPTSDQSTVITKAKNALSLAISLRTQYYVDKAQTAINLVEDATIKAELQAKLDAIVIK